MSLSPHIFEIYRALLHKESGLVVTPQKTYLLETRLKPVALKHGFEDIDTLALVLNNPQQAQAKLDVIEAMTTNETSFFRDIKIYDRLEKIALPQIAEKRKNTKTMRIWSSASSTGQEPYSVAMTVRQNPAFNDWTVEIVATDISSDVLEYSRSGIYSQFEIQRGLPITHHMKYFSESGNNKWAICNDLKKMIRFRQFNLLSSMAALGTFDIVLCRNVLIYFDEKTKADVLNRIHDQLSFDGFLFLGGAETVIGVTDRFKAVPGEAGLYVKDPAAQSRQSLSGVPSISAVR